MTSESTVNADSTKTHSVTRRRLRLCGALAFAAAASVAAALIARVPRPATAEADEDVRECGNRTLRGEYGLVGTGTRAVGPATETFATVSMVTYDGEGGFTAVGTSHGQTTGVRGGPVSGTYHVNADCSGRQVTNIPIPGVPPLEDAFVIVDKGREVRTVVTSPATTIATANLRKR